MNGLGVLQAAIVAQVADLNWQIVGVGDLNGDNKADLVWRHSVTGQVVVWLMNGLTSVTGQVAVWFMNGLEVLQAAIVTEVADLELAAATVGYMFAPPKPRR